MDQMIWSGIYAQVIGILRVPHGIASSAFELAKYNFKATEARPACNDDIEDPLQKENSLTLRSLPAERSQTKGWWSHQALDMMDSVQNLKLPISHPAAYSSDKEPFRSPQGYQGFYSESNTENDWRGREASDGSKQSGH